MPRCTTTIPQVSQQRFAQGRSPAAWFDYIGSPENLGRPANPKSATPRPTRSADVRSFCRDLEVSEHQKAALRYLATRPNSANKLLIIGEDWSSDCRRDIPTLIRIGEAMNIEVRILTRDSVQGKEPGPQDATDIAGNGDLMHQFLNHKNGERFQSVPIGAFFTKAMAYICHFTEYPAMYQKDPFLSRLRAGKHAQHQERTTKAFVDLQTSPFFYVWASAAVDEIITNLWDRVVL